MTLPLVFEHQHQIIANRKKTPQCAVGNWEATHQSRKMNEDDVIKSLFRPAARARLSFSVPQRDDATLAPPAETQLQKRDVPRSHLLVCITLPFSLQQCILCVGQNQTTGPHIMCCIDKVSHTCIAIAPPQVWLMLCVCCRVRWHESAVHFQQRGSSLIGWQCHCHRCHLAPFWKTIISRKGSAAAVWCWCPTF